MRRTKTDQQMNMIVGAADRDRNGSCRPKTAADKPEQTVSPLRSNGRPIILCVKNQMVMKS